MFHLRYDLLTGNLPGGTGTHHSRQLLEYARADDDTVLKELGSGLSGLSETEADSRLRAYPNNPAQR